MSQQFVYFIQDSHSGWIKIGVAQDVDARLRQLQTANRSKLRLLGYVEGNAIVERRIHQRLAEYRLRGEWFTRDGVMDYLKRIPADKWVSATPSTADGKKKKRWTQAEKKARKRAA